MGTKIKQEIIQINIIPELAFFIFDPSFMF